MLEVILVLAGPVVGFGVAYVMFNLRCASGTLRIDHSNPEKDLYRFDIYDLDTLDKKVFIKLKIDHNADLSQK